MSAHTDPIAPADLQWIAHEIGPRLARLLGPRRPQRIDLAESLLVFHLYADRLAHANFAGQDVADAVEATARFHHQIRFDGVAAAFARSIHTDAPRGQPAWEVREVAIAELAADVDRALVVAEADLEETTRVRLVIAPSYHLHALWLTDDWRSDRVVVADAPSRFQYVPPFKVLPSREFLAGLHSEREVIGIS